MGIKAIKYSSESQAKIAHFKSLPESEINGSYWDKQDDDDLKKLKKEIKEHYLNAQDNTCPYCQQKNPVKHNAAWDTEHIIPKSSHPKLMFESINLCVSCKDCNTEKSDKNVLKNKNRKTLSKKNVDYIIVHPHLDSYDEHIKVIDGYYFIPITEKGRRTIETCGLLRFIYEYTSYTSVNTSSKEKVTKLASMLMEANNAIEEAHILHMMTAFTSELSKSSRKTFLDGI